MSDILKANTGIENLNKQIIIANKLLLEAASHAKAQQNNMGDSDREAALKNLLAMVREHMTGIEINSEQAWEAVRISEGHKIDEIWAALKLTMRVASVKEALREPLAFQDNKIEMAWGKTRIASLQVALLKAELEVAKLQESVREKVSAISMPQGKLSIILTAEMNIVKTQAILHVTELQVAAWQR